MPGKAMTSARFCGQPGVVAPELHNSGSIPPVRCLIPERHNGGTWTLRSLTAFAVSKLALTTGSSVLLRRKMSGGGASELLNSDDLVEIWLDSFPQLEELEGTGWSHLTSLHSSTAGGERVRAALTTFHCESRFLKSLLPL